MCDLTNVMTKARAEPKPLIVDLVIVPLNERVADNNWEMIRSVESCPANERAAVNDFAVAWAADTSPERDIDPIRLLAVDRIIAPLKLNDPEIAWKYWVPLVIR